MIKKIIGCIAFIALSSIIFAKILSIPFEPGEINIKINKSDNLRAIEVNNDINQTYDLAFENLAKTYEIRILEFKKQSGECSIEDLELAFFSFSQAVVLNMVEDEKSIVKIIPFDNRGVKKENNGDTGYAVFVKFSNDQSKFYKGYNFAVINCFLNYKKGIVIKTIMFNTTDVMDDKNYSKDFDIFKF